MLYHTTEEPSWDDRARDWVAVKVRRELLFVRDNPKSNALSWVRELLSKPGALEWLVSWYRDRSQLCAVWTSREWYDPTEELECFWQFEGDAFRASLKETMELCRDACRYPDLDAWLTAELKGELESVGPKEPAGDELLPEDQRHEFRAAMWERRNAWPRACRDCGEEFVPHTSKAVRCLACLKRRNPKAHKSKECVDCHKNFEPHHHTVRRCPGCRQAHQERVQ